SGKRAPAGAAGGGRARAGAARAGEGTGRLVAGARGALAVGGRGLDAGQGPAPAAPRHGEREAAGAAADVEHALAVAHADEREERLGQPAAPPAHQPLVAVAVGGPERRGTRHDALVIAGAGARP